jgi:SAM-dependent methyltransferase
MADQPDMQRPRADDWPAYFEAVAGLPPRDTLIAALDRFDREPLPAAPRLAVDLGCGSGRDTLEMLRRGWCVLAVDGHPEGIERLRAGLSPDAAARLDTLVARFEHAPIPPCDLVNASFSIPHCAPADFPPMWSRIAAAIRPGGRFAGQFFGVNDGWARRPDAVTRTYHTRPQVEAMLGAFDVEMLDEVERPGKTAFGEPKDWHVFHVVARKKP